MLNIKTSGSTYRHGSAYIELTRENELTLEMPRCHITKSAQSWSFWPFV